MERKFYFILGSIFLVLLVGGIYFFSLRVPEDYWYYDERGVWVKHGAPLNMPSYVLTQQQAIICAMNLYNSSSLENLSSQCLGSCNDYAVDLVSVPRSEEDNKDENKCETIVRGKLSHVIELDVGGNIVRII